MLTSPFEKREEGPIKSHWVLPLVHGHVDQASECAQWNGIERHSVFTVMMRRTDGLGSCGVRHAHRSPLQTLCRREVLEARCE